VFGSGGSGPAAQVEFDVAFGVANRTAQLPKSAPGALHALLRQEALADAEALGRLRGREQAIEGFACKSVTHLCSGSPLIDERRRPVTVMIWRRARGRNTRSD
jgi:hypothetical protein